jgi:hypothetical protein
MRTAPPVSVHCTGGAFWRGVQTLLPALATAAFGAWVAGHSQWSVGTTAAVVWLLSALVAVLAWRAAAPRVATLNWDGQEWTVDEMAGQLLVMMDLGPWLLLRWMPAQRGRTRWLAVSASEAGAAWHGLRAALYAKLPLQDATTGNAGPHV